MREEEGIRDSWICQVIFSSGVEAAQGERRESGRRAKKSTDRTYIRNRWFLD